MSAYDTPQEQCPYCKEMMDADWVDNGVGMVQCGPYHCYDCGASEIGPEYSDWMYKDREGNTLYLPGKRRYIPLLKKMVTWSGPPILKPNHPFSNEELDTGYYKGKVSPYANTVGGQVIDHKTAKELYNVGLLDEKEV